MLPAVTILLSISTAPPPTTVEQEGRIKSALEIAVARMDPSECDFAKPRPSDLLAVIGTYGGAVIPTVTVAGQDEDSSLADIVIDKGLNPVYLVLASYEPLIWRIQGDVGRVRQVTVFHRNGAGVLGIAGKRVQFVNNEGKCRLQYEVYGERTVETDVPVLAMFGRRADAIGGDGRLYRATLSANAVMVEKLTRTKSEDRIVMIQAGDPVLPKSAGLGGSFLEREFHERFPGGIAKIDLAKLVASGAAENYEVLPMTAGAFQLEQQGALIPASAADIRRWKDRAVIGGHVQADRIKNLDFYHPYRVTRPIRLPSGLCGGYSMTFFVPARDYVKGDPCHSNIYVDDGTIMAGY